MTTRIDAHIELRSGIVGAEKYSYYESMRLERVSLNVHVYSICCTGIHIRAEAIYNIQDKWAQCCKVVCMSNYDLWAAKRSIVY